MSILFLSESNFSVQQGNNGQQILAIQNIPQTTLVLFYSTECVHCNHIIPIMKQCTSHVKGCDFAMVNLSHHKRIIHQSKSTIAPINYVPLVIMYNHGKPIMRYDGPPEINSLLKFIGDIFKFLSKQSFVNELENEIPPYTTGIPVCNDKVCYLNINDAYKK